MKTVFLLPLSVVLIFNTGDSSGLPASPKNKVTTFVTYAYEQGDDPIPVPSGGFNTPELKSELEAPAVESQEISSETRIQQQQHLIHPDLARDLQPPREVPLIDFPLTRGPIPIPQQLQQQQPFPPSAPEIQSNLNLINEQDSSQIKPAVNTQTSSVIIPVKTQSFSIIKAPMIQEHSVTNDNDFMKALAHAFGVTNRLTFNSPDIQKNFKNAPEIINTPVAPPPPTIVDQNIQLVQQLPLTQVLVNPSPSSAAPLAAQSLQQALIQSLQRMPGQITSTGQHTNDPGLYRFISHGNGNQEAIKYPTKYKYSVTVADGDDIGNNNESKTDETSPTVTPNEVVIQEEVKVPLIHEQPQQLQQVYNTEVFSAITQPAVQQQQLQSLPPPQTIALPNPHPVLAKYFPQSLHVVNNNDGGVLVQDSGEAQRVIVKPQETQVVDPNAPRKYSDSTVVSKTTFTRFHPKVFSYRNTEEKVQQNEQVIINTEAPIVQQNQQVLVNTEAPVVQLVQQVQNVQSVEQQQHSGEKQVFSPGNELSSEAQKQYEQPNQRFVYRYVTPDQGNENLNSNENSQEIAEYNSQSVEDSQEDDSKFAIFEPQKVQQIQTGPQYLTGFPAQRNQFRRRRPNGRRLKIRRKKVKTRRLAPVLV